MNGDPEIIDGIPNISATPEEEAALRPAGGEPYAALSNINMSRVQACFGLALHMHQPTIPAAHADLRTADLISNLQHMMGHQNAGDNHNAPVFLWCYSRMSDFIRELAGQGHNPRIMLDYSGNLLWGLRQMGQGHVLENLRLIASGESYRRYVEWLGTMWSHAVVSSTPVPDIKLHIMAWRRHFASIFGFEAARRVKGFSPPEMHLPIHPDVCYQYVKALKECGYEWLMVQQHTIENLDGGGIVRPHFPHRLVARNSVGEVEEITVLVKTQGSDTKLVAQMQPYYEAKTLRPQDYAGAVVPPYVLQIGDGENGGVMMNEFPSAYKKDFGSIGTEGVVAMNGSEYLEMIRRMGARDSSFVAVQPVSQHRIWDEVACKRGPGACDEAIERITDLDPSFNLDRASWTNNISWVKNYESVLDPMNRLSSMFHSRFDNDAAARQGFSFRKALLFLLLSQTSCFRYWGHGIWTEYGKEICRRGIEYISGL
ncbi:MAG TPA: hypothetical protein VLX68_15110 [Chitinivibrionales bacterium]|nr:hypothetical protein [Chitinivibrionales bacterium]